MSSPPPPAAAAGSKKVPVVCHGHSRPIVDVNFSHVTNDGFFISSASKDGQPMLRHGDSGDWYGTFAGHKGAVWSCVLNRPALLCATGSADFSARLWDACNGNQLHEFQHSHIVRCTAFADTQNKLATGGMEKVVRIYDLDRPEADPAMLLGAPSGLRCLAWIHDDLTMLCSFTDKPGLGVYDTRTLQQVRTVDTPSPVTSMEVSFDGGFITLAEGFNVRVLESSTLQQLKEFKLKHPVESASFAPSKNKFVAGGEDMWVHLYDYSSGEELDVNKGHHGPVHNVRFSPTYESYASGSEDGTIRIWWLDGAASNGMANGASA